MPIHRQFTASCDSCEQPFNGDSQGYGTCRRGVSHYSDHLKEAMRDAGWKVSNKLICPACQDAMAIHAITINQATNKEKQQ